MIRFLLKAALCAAFNFSYAQLNIEWQKCYGGISYEQANAVELTDDGGFILAGWSQSFEGLVADNHGVNDYWVVKTNSEGEIVWTKSIGGSGNDYCRDIVKMTDGGYLLVGHSYSNDDDVSENMGFDDFWVVKITDDGSIEWEKSFGGSGSDEAYAASPISDGGCILAGSTGSNDGDVSENKGLDDFWIVRLNASGDLVWERSYGGSSTDIAHSVFQTSDGDFVILGKTLSNDGDVSGNNGFYDFWVIKLTDSGELIWQNCLGGSYHDNGKCAIEASDGGIVLAGETASEDGDVSDFYGGWSDVWLVKLSADGLLEWENSFGGSVDETPEKIIAPNEGGFMLICDTGTFYMDGTTSVAISDAWVIKVDDEGELEWEQRFGGSIQDTFYDFEEISPNQYIFAGRSRSSDIDVPDFYGEDDYWLVKMKKDHHSEIENRTQVDFSIFPNPASTALNIQSELTIETINVHNTLGQTVLSLNNINNNTTQINTRDMENGVYIISIITEGKIMTQQFQVMH